MRNFTVGCGEFFWGGLALVRTSESPAIPAEKSKKSYNKISVPSFEGANVMFGGNIALKKVKFIWYKPNLVK